MKCKLCLEEKQLLKKSHIIPDFMHKGLRDEDNKFFLINIEDYSKFEKKYTGEFESNILCQECDNKVIGQYETYAHKILYGGRINEGENIEFENQKNQSGLVSTCVKGIDYKKFKLFLLSLLWRSSISSRKFYSQISLGPHEEIIRRIILSGNPGNQMDYPCFISTYLNNKNKLSPDFIGQPIKVKNNDGTKYVFLIGGFVYMFFISRHNIPDWLSECVINDCDRISIPHMSEEMGVDMLNYFLGVDMFKCNLK